MRAIFIKTDEKSINEIDIEMHVNTVYTFFSSILIDELSTIKNHMVYTDANAISQMKTPFFIGEQLVVGDALIVGHTAMQDGDAIIPLNDLESLISYELSQFYKDVFELIAKTDINLYRPFNVLQNENQIQLNTEWVLYVFNMADDRTKEYFLSELKNSIDSNEDTVKFMTKMAQLAVNSAS